MWLPDTTDPQYEAFIVGFILPIIAACGGWLIGLIRKMIQMINSDHL